MKQTHLLAGLAAALLIGWGGGRAIEAVVPSLFGPSASDVLGRGTAARAPSAPDPEAEAILGGTPLRVARFAREGHVLEEILYESDEDRLRVVVVTPAQDADPTVTATYRTDLYQRDEVMADGQRTRIVLATPTGALRERIPPAASDDAGMYRFRVEPHEYPLRENSIGPGEDVEAWRKEVRPAFESILRNGLPQRPAHGAQEVGEERLGGRRAAVLEMAGVGGRTLRALLLLPDSPPPWRAALAIEGHTGSTEYPYTHELAAAGYIVLAPQVNYHEEPGGGWSLQQQRVEEARIALDYLDSREDVVPGYLAVGLSLGGDLALLVGAVDERVAAVVASGALPVLRHEPGDRPERHWQRRGGICQCGWVPGLAAAFNGRDLAMLVAPRPLVLETGLMDRGAPADKAMAVAKAIRQVGGNVVHALRPGAHVWAGTLPEGWK